MRTRSPAAAAVPLALALAACGGDPESSLYRVGSCEELQDAITEQAREEADARFERSFFDFLGGGGMEDNVAIPENSGGAPTADRAFSDTNVQVEGVDEPDLVETDGTWIYALAGVHVTVTEAWPPEDTAEVARLSLEGSPRGLLLVRDQALLVVLSEVSQAAPAPESDLGTGLDRGVTVTKVTLLDVADPTAPEVLRETYVEGRMLDARRIDQRLHVVTRGVHAPRDYQSAGSEREAKRAIKDSTLGDWTPKRHDNIRDGLRWRTETSGAAACDCYWASNRRSGYAVTTVSTLDLTDPKGKVRGTAVLGDYPTVYATHESLYVTGSERREGLWASGDDNIESIIHRFDIRSAKDAPDYLGTAEVPGWTLDQFALDEYQGHLRVATTDPDDGRSAGVHVLAVEEDALRPVGEVTGLAPGESIFAVRFVGDTGYVVTFLQVDPLFVIDLSDPTEPRKLGELKIPGFSNYLHPMEGGRLLGVGCVDQAWGEAQVSVFDVSDPADPRVESRLALPGSTSCQGFGTDHHAFNYFPEASLLLLPVPDEAGSLAAIQVVPGEALTELARLSPSPVVSAAGYGYDTWCTAFRRSVIIDQSLYAVSAAGIRVGPVATPGELTAIAPFPDLDPCAGRTYYDARWDW